MSRLLEIDPTYALVLAIAFAAAFAFVVGVRNLLPSRRDVLRERLQRLLGGRPAAPGPELTTPARAPWETALEPFARVARPVDARELGHLRRRLSHGGLRNERALVGYLGTKVLFGIGFALMFLVVERFWPQPGLRAAVLTIACTALGFYAPSLWLRGRIQARQRQLSHALPNALDLLVTCVEAGLGLEAAIQRVAGELELGAPLLAAELQQTELEMRAGVTRGDAFRRMADRTGVEELRNLSAIIIQTQIFGTSIAKSLRVQAEAIRVRRMQVAEERAAAASVKMTVPLILCIAPALFAVLLGPAIVKIVRDLLPTLSGGH